MLKPKRRLVLARQTLRTLAAVELSGIAGGFSDPAVSCDSCTHCTCKPPE